MNVFLILRIVFILNSVDPDEMLHHASFHLGFHSQSTHLAVPSIQRVKSINLMHDCNMSRDNVAF